jgi:hypothetical protein
MAFPHCKHIPREDCIGLGVLCHLGKRDTVQPSTRRPYNQAQHEKRRQHPGRPLDGIADNGADLVGGDDVVQRIPGRAVDTPGWHQIVIRWRDGIPLCGGECQTRPPFFRNAGLTHQGCRLGCWRRWDSGDLFQLQHGIHGETQGSGQAGNGPETNVGRPPPFNTVDRDFTALRPGSKRCLAPALELSGFAQVEPDTLHRLS